MRRSGLTFAVPPGTDLVTVRRRASRRIWGQTPRSGLAEKATADEVDTAVRRKPMPELSSEAGDFRAASELFAPVRGWLRVGGVVRNMSTGSKIIDAFGAGDTMYPRLLSSRIILPADREADLARPDVPRADRGQFRAHDAAAGVIAYPRRSPFRRRRRRAEEPRHPCLPSAASPAPGRRSAA